MLPGSLRESVATPWEHLRDGLQQEGHRSQTQLGSRSRGDEARSRAEARVASLWDSSGRTAQASVH